MKRRDFLFGSFASVFLVACGAERNADGSRAPDGAAPSKDAGAADGGDELVPTSAPEASDAFFPQGLASGDPGPDRVLLWTRIDPVGSKRADAATLAVSFVIAEDEDLTAIIGRGTVETTADADFTVRVVATELEPGRFYYYRFESGGTTTRVGRTKTAPSHDADVAVKLAFCACQDYIGRYWHSWKAFLEVKPDLDFILWLGDYIYESINDGLFQSTGGDRKIDLPDGGIDTSPKQDGSRIAAGSLADYRAIYKAYRSDPLLREVHRLYPFVVTWDDHEFANDCWQDHTTSFSDKDPKTGGVTTEQDTPRRMAASRAFSEYQLLDITYDQNATFPNDIKIYRKLRYGKHVELFMTDQRMYRSDHVVPEGPVDMDVGKPLKNNSFGSRYFVRKSGFDPREAAAKPTMLGAEQKAWFLDAVKKSDATWKVWGNEVQLYQMILQLSDIPSIPAAFSYTAYINCDQWDGYRTERAEILGELSRAGVEDILVLTGDIHAFFAAEIHVDFDNPGAKPIAVEYVTAGISSTSLPALVDNVVPTDSAIRPVVNYFLDGANEALLSTNQHLRHADTDGYGFSVAYIDGDRVEVNFVRLPDPKTKEYRGIIGQQKFVTKRGESRIEAL